MTVVPDVTVTSVVYVVGCQIVVLRVAVIVVGIVVGITVGITVGTHLVLTVVVVVVFHSVTVSV
jgi:hypothetical protein